MRQNQTDDVDDELRRLMLKCCAVKTRRNALSPACSLPPEILSHIFRYHLLYQKSRTGVQDARWFRFSHVCVYWREVAIHDAGLWGDICLFQPSWAREMLERSKQHPIHIDVGLALPRSNVYEVVADTLRNHTPRIRTLRLTAWATRTLSRMLCALSGDAKQLQTLEVTLKIDRSDIDFVIGNSFLGGYMPKLKTLVLSNCIIRWDSPMLRGLTELRLDFSPEVEETHDLEMLLAALDGLPDLRILHLKSCLPSHVGSGLSTRLPRPQISLPRLCELHISGDVLACGEFLRYITIREGCVVDIYAQDSPYSQFSLLTESLLEAQAFCGSQALVKMAVEDYINGSLKISGMSNWGFESTPPREDFECFLDMNTWVAEAPALAMRSALTNVDLRKLRYLSILDLTYVSTKLWKSTFGASRSLRSVLVRGTSFYGLLNALEDNSFFPKLKQLVLEHVDFQVGQVARLQACLEKRRQRIQYVEIQHCFSIDSYDVMELGDAIDGVVTWDKYEGNFSQSEPTSPRSSDESDNDSTHSRYGTGYNELDGLEYDVW